MQTLTTIDGSALPARNRPQLGRDGQDRAPRHSGRDRDGSQLSSLALQSTIPLSGFTARTNFNLLVSHAAALITQGIARRNGDAAHVSTAGVVAAFARDFSTQES
jgi:hypothetical protein